MNRKMLQSHLKALTPREMEYKKGHQDLSDLPFNTRKINGADVLYIPIRELVSYKSGPLLSIKKHSRFQSFPLHCHDDIEINYMYSGSCRQIINGKEYTLTEGQTLFLNMDTIHTILPLEEEDILININLNTDFLITNFLNRFSYDSVLTRFFVNTLTDSIRHDAFLFFPSENSEQLKIYLENLLCEWYSPSIVARDIMESLLSLIISELVIVYKDTYTEQLEKQNSSPVLPILRYVEENYLTCNLEGTARIFNLNPNYLSNLLKKHTGLSYRELVQQQKLTASEHLLRSSKLSVSEIAHMVGYENISFFYKKFREKNHCLPNEYRNAFRNINGVS